jgi:hypothetical protein
VRGCLLLFVVAAVACGGPAASDAAICRDVIVRLCDEPRCAEVDSALNPGSDCQQALTQRSGCGDDAFTFSLPTRARFLECRVPLLRQNARAAVSPGCDNVQEAFTNCPDLVRFFGGTP